MTETKLDNVDCEIGNINPTQLVQMSMGKASFKITYGTESVGVTVLLDEYPSLGKILAGGINAEQFLKILDIGAYTYDKMSSSYDGNTIALAKSVGKQYMQVERQLRDLTLAVKMSSSVTLSTMITTPDSGTSNVNAMEVIRNILNGSYIDLRISPSPYGDNAILLTFKNLHKVTIVTVSTASEIDIIHRKLVSTTYETNIVIVVCTEKVSSTKLSINPLMSYSRLLVVLDNFGSFPHAIIYAVDCSISYITNYKLVVDAAMKSQAAGSHAEVSSLRSKIASMTTQINQILPELKKRYDDSLVDESKAVALITTTFRNARDSLMKSYASLFVFNGGDLTCDATYSSMINITPQNVTPLKQIVESTGKFTCVGCGKSLKSKKALKYHMVNSCQKVKNERATKINPEKITTAKKAEDEENPLKTYVSYACTCGAKPGTGNDIIKHYISGGCSTFSVLDKELITYIVTRILKKTDYNCTKKAKGENYQYPAKNITDTLIERISRETGIKIPKKKKGKKSESESEETENSETENSESENSESENSETEGENDNESSSPVVSRPAASLIAKVVLPPIPKAELTDANVDDNHLRKPVDEEHPRKLSDESRGKKDASNLTLSPNRLQ